MKEKFRNIGIIGSGNMGQAIVKGLKAADFKKNILIIDKDKRKSKKISKKLGVKQVADVKILVEMANIIIICIKPQDIDSLLDKMSHFKLKDKLIISIAAGVSTSYLLKKLKARVAIIRIMPNINAFAQRSVNAICEGKHAKKKDLVDAHEIFDALGENFIVSEKKMDAITAISGSGPAYVALFIKALSQAAQKNGLTISEAEKIVAQTLEGTLEVLKKHNIKPEDFIRRVKSKGGITEAAFKVFKKQGFEKIILEAVKAAKKRSLKLGKK